MYNFKLTLSLPDSLFSQWESHADDALGKNTHPDRKKGYCFAREALRLVLQEYNLAPTIPDLTLQVFHCLNKWPEYTLSLSHSKRAGAAVVAKRTEYLAVGIDIELEDREVKPETLLRISHPQDIKLRNIEIWCLKEAIFKCLMNTDKFEHPFEFSQIQITKELWSHSPSGLAGAWELKHSMQHVIALASIPLG
ncbi:MAG TPA: hypothetical protein VNJ08_16360 [Bacteriovoracaceae bacterium]|nr:hypothetical protein [Bacteriovoracaceae bacterium]